MFEDSHYFENFPEMKEMKLPKRPNMGSKNNRRTGFSRKSTGDAAVAPAAGAGRGAAGLSDPASWLLTARVNLREFFMGASSVP